LLRTRRFIAQKVLHAGDTPHTIALGAAIAMFIAFLPLIGLQTIVAVAIAALFRANKAVCIPIVWITNPFTAVPVYSVCLYIGRLLLASPQDDTDVEVLNQLGEQEANGLFDAEFWMNLLKQLATLGTELWLGCAIVGVVAAILSYFAARWAVIAYREKRRLRELRRTLFRAQLQDDRASQRSGAV
jgi:hypothetical protein